MTPEILRDTRRLLALCEAIRRAEGTREAIRDRLRRREADDLRALLDAILDAPDATTRDEAVDRARDVLRGAR